MDEFWINDITELFKHNRLLDVWPKKFYSIDRKYNAITRLIVYLTLLGYFLTKSIYIVVSAVIVILVFVFLYKHQSSVVEGLDSTNSESAGDDFSSSDFQNIMKEERTFPTKKNPLMNVLLPEIKYNKNRKPAAESYNESVLRNINEKAQFPELSHSLTDNRKLYRDLGDNLTFEHTMRNFHTMPNTKIPNDQKKFAQFCYGNMASCKDGDDVQCNKNMRRLGNAFF